MKQVATILFLSAAATASPAPRVDNQGFYATRDQQIFKREDIRELEQGYLQGDDVPYFTWEGFVSGKQLYFEGHGNQIKLILGKNVRILQLEHAPALASSDKDAPSLNEMGSDFYVKSAKNDRGSLLCIESLGPDRYIRPRPYWDVYLITDPLRSPRLYRLSGINASCRGIERAQDGTLLVPIWDIKKNRSPGVIINYSAIEKNRFRQTNIHITGSIASEDAQEYVIEQAE